MFFYLAKIYACICWRVQGVFGVNLRGLGFALRLIRADRVLSVMGVKMYFNHKVATSYANPITGIWNEPETHLLLNHVIPLLPAEAAFIDVGANVGEMVADVTRHKNIVKIIAFEPVPECARAIRETLSLNGYKNYQVIEKLAGEKTASVKFSTDGRNSVGSSVYSAESAGSASEVQMTTLDSETAGLPAHAVLLIDVEGYEPAVLKGGARFIREKQPLIIFEYNAISKKHYALSDIRKILGDGYAIYRLRPDGRLDQEMGNTWNCVAVPGKTVFETICGDIIVNAAGSKSV